MELAVHSSLDCDIQNQDTRLAEVQWGEQKICTEMYRSTANSILPLFSPDGLTVEV